MDLEALLAQLADLDSIEDLAPLDKDLRAAYKEVRKAPITDESVEQLKQLADGIGTVAKAAADRQAAQVARETAVAEYDTIVDGPGETPEDEQSAVEAGQEGDEVTKADEVVAEATDEAAAPALAGALAAETTETLAEGGSETTVEAGADGAETPAETVAAEAPAPVTASAASFAEMNSAQPESTKPKGGAVTTPRVQAFAHLDVVGLGDKPADRDDVLQAMASKLNGMRGATGAGDGENIALFSLRDREHPEWGGSLPHLGMDPMANKMVMDEVMSPQAITAAGGVCAARMPSYNFIHLGQNAEPLRGSLPNFAADRGGVSIPESNDINSVGTPDNIVTAAGTPHQAVDTLTLAQDTSGYTKVYQEFDCVTFTPYDVEAETFYTQHGVMNKRFFPELIAHDLDNAEDAFSRYSETQILRKFDAFSKVKTVTHNQNVDVSTELLNVIDQYATARRNRHRMANNAPVRVWLPYHVVSMIQRGFSLKVGDASPEQLALTQAQIEGWFRNRNINVTWHYDGYLTGEVYGAQPNNAATLGDPTVIWIRMFHEGAIGILDGGSEDFGVVRDSALIKINKYQQFRERFWNLMMPGIWGARIRLTVCANGASAGTISPDSLCDGGS